MTDASPSPIVHRSIVHRLRRWTGLLADADVIFFLLPPLMLLLAAGTIAQRWIGLYRAHEMFFSAFILWLGPVPLPGGFTLLGMLCAGLVLKFLLKSRWSLKRAGIILTHLGALVLLAGGLVTALYARESFMVIPEGQETRFMYDYTVRSLMIFRDGREYRRLPFSQVASWEREALPFGLRVEASCENCAIEKQEAPPAGARAMAQFMALKPAPPEKEPEANLSGVSLRLSRTGAAQTDGAYILFDAMPKPVIFHKDGHEFSLMFGKDQHELPFSLALRSFEREMYNGTDKARSYVSELTLRDGELSWPVRVEMNAPLRYHGYTFFQSSFDEGPGGAATILAVVENRGRLLPYIGTAILGAGLLLHLCTVLFDRRRA
jgi:hypothetical protein